MHRVTADAPARQPDAGWQFRGLTLYAEVQTDESILNQVFPVSAGPLHRGSLVSMQTPAEISRPSPSYLLTLALGCIGLPSLGIGLGGALIGRHGGDPFSAMDVDGMVMFLLGFGVLFATRLIFWPVAPADLRTAVRTVVSLLFVFCVPLSLLGLVLALGLPETLAHRSLAIYFSVLALLCQPVALTWLLRYRHEGL